MASRCRSYVLEHRGGGTIGFQGARENTDNEDMPAGLERSLQLKAKTDGGHDLRTPSLLHGEKLWICTDQDAHKKVGKERHAARSRPARSHLAALKGYIRTTLDRQARGTPLGTPGLWQVSSTMTSTTVSEGSSQAAFRCDTCGRRKERVSRLYSSKSAKERAKFRCA